MKIVYISDSIIPSKSANSVHVMKMCSSFTKNGHQVILICRQGDKKINDEYEYYGVPNNFKIKKFFWPNIKGGGLIYGFLIKVFLSKLSSDYVVYGRSIYGLLYAAKKGFSSVFEVHTPPRNNFHYKKEKELFALPGFKGLVTISQSLANKYYKDFPLLKNKKNVVAHDGADIYLDGQLKIKLKGNNNISVGYVGSLYPGKGVENIVEIAKICKDMDFYILGGDNDIVENWQKHTENIKNLYFYGHIQHSNLYLYMNSFDIMLAPYQVKVYVDYKKNTNTVDWMSPLKIFEYMSYGKAIICSDLPVIREILVNNINSLLCDPVNMESWAEALNKLRNSNIREKIGEAAKSLFLEKYTWEKRANDVVKIFN